MARTAQLARLQLVVPDIGYSISKGKAVNNKVKLLTVGLAQSVRIEDNFGTKAENVIGTPLPVFHPGFQQTTISIEKATVDGYSFQNFGAFNPLWASVGSVYNRDNLLSLKDIPEIAQIAPNDDAIFPFMFILAVKDIVSDSYTKSNFPQIGEDYNPNDKDMTKKATNSVGSYVCVLNTASISLSSSNAVIMDNISAYARPLAGSWFSEALASAFKEENGTNGMNQNINAALYGYFSDNIPGVTKKKG